MTTTDPGSADPTFRGTEGNLPITDLEWRDPLCEAFIEGAVQMGIPRNKDYNGTQQAGVSYVQRIIRNGRRVSAARGYLYPAMSRGNLDVRTNAHVTNLMLDGKRAVGVRFRQNGEQKFARCTGEVILAAGSIGTAQTLMLSGIGPGAQLRQHGIPVVLEKPGVGEGMQDHLQLRMIYKVTGVQTLNEMVTTFGGKARMAFDYAFFRRGPLTMAPSQLGLFTRSDKMRDRANIQYHVQPLSLDKFGDPLHPFPAFTASVANVQPTWRGWVRVTSADPFAAPVIAPNYLSTEEDRKVAADSLRLTRRIVAQPALAKYRPEEYLPGPSYQTDEDLARAAGDIGTTIFHPVGTCRMGRADDAGAVVDAQLRVHGIEGLRVVDASVMPTITSGNTNSPTIMIAEKASEMIRAARKARARGEPGAA